MQECINFDINGDVYYSFLDYLEGKNDIFTYVNSGASKIVFKFHELTTDKDYVIKLENENWGTEVKGMNRPEQYEIWDDICDKEGFLDSHTEMSNSLYKQTQKEIVLYLLAKENGLDDLYAPIILKHSSISLGFSVMPFIPYGEFCDDYIFNGESIVKEIKKATARKLKKEGLYKSLENFLERGVVYATINIKGGLEERVKKGISLVDVVEKLCNVLHDNFLNELDLFDDLSFDNFGIYNGTPVLIDYGYGDIDIDYWLSIYEDDYSELLWEGA